MDDYDRTWKDDDGRTYYGYDDDDGEHTDWYDENGNLDARTDTPSDDEQTANDEGWLHY